MISSDNPADFASRGLYPQQLLSLDLWWYGPLWLSQFTEDESCSSSLSQSGHEDVAAHTTQNYLLVRADDPITEPNPVLESLAKISDFSKILRVVGYCQRWRLRPATGTDNRGHQALTAAEWTATRRSVTFLVQREHFAKEIDLCQRGRSIQKGSPLLRLRPFIGEDGLLRVGGRLTALNADVFGETSGDSTPV